MKKVSVVAIAKNKRELEPLIKALRKQRYRNFEFVYSTKKGIPQGWNDAISKANGEILVLTESDAMPLNNKWLEEMVNAVKKHNKNDSQKRTLIRGIEISPLPWCWCNIACYASTLKKNKLNETYPLAEDTELFSRLKKLGYRGLELPIAPVVHKRHSRRFGKAVRNSFMYGQLLTKIALKYGNIGFDSKRKEGSNILEREITIIFSRLSFLFGAIVGFVSYHLNKLKESMFG